MLTSAAIVERPGEEFRIEEIELASPRAGEVLVRVTGVGICHTDVVARAGGTPMPLPAILGHEGAGYVEAVGEGVAGLTVGDAVVLSFRYCGTCPRCRDGDPAYCLDWMALNMTGQRLPHGGHAASHRGAAIAANFFGQSSFAGYALAHESCVIKIPSDLPVELMGPLGCAVQTGAGAVLRSLDVAHGSSIIIFGGGAVGLSALLGAATRDCSPIIVVEPNAARRDLALSLGATHVFDPAASDVSAEVRALAPTGLDAALDTTGIVSVLETALSLLGPRGSLGILGIPHDPAGALAIPLWSAIAMGLTVKGIMEGDSDPKAFIPELIELYRNGELPFTKLIETFPLAEINEAIAAQERGGCVKAVLLPG